METIESIQSPTLEFRVDADYRKTEPQPEDENSMRKVLSIRDFRLLFAGVSTSLLGDQFALIATPWLVLQLTGDPLAVGIVLALEGVPRALFMLFGGAITDRFSPRIIMLASDIVRFVLATLMAVVVFTGTVQMWMLYAFGLGFGLVAGFAVPAGNSIVPMLVRRKRFAGRQFNCDGRWSIGWLCWAGGGRDIDRQLSPNHFWGSG